MTVGADGDGLSLDGSLSLGGASEAVTLFADHLVSTAVSLESVSDVAADNTVVTAAGPARPFPVAAITLKLKLANVLIFSLE